MNGPDPAGDDRNRVSGEDRDRWNDEAAYEAELQADADWRHDQTMADWAADREDY